MNDPYSVGLFAYDGVDALALVGVHDALERASETCAVDATVYSLVPSEGVTAASGLELVPDDVLIGTPDAVVVPGGWTADDEQATPADLPKRLGQLADAGATVAGIGSGVLALGEAGLLDGHRATAVPGHRDELEARASELVDAPVVVDGDVLTAAGPDDAIDLAMRLVELACGEAVERESVVERSN